MSTALDFPIARDAKELPDFPQQSSSVIFTMSSQAGTRSSQNGNGVVDEVEVMEQMMTALSIFKVLPDVDQEISSQVLQPPLQTFTCFPKLPVELKLEIFKNMLPNPVQYELSVAAYFSRQRRGKRRTLPLPVTLHISCASRKVTLKYRQMIWLGRGPRSRREITHGLLLPRALNVIDPMRDNICVDWDELAYTWRGRKGFNLVATAQQIVFQKIRVLDIQGAALGSPDTSGLEEWTSPTLSCLRFFPNLEELHFTFRRQPPSHQWPGPSEWDLFVKSFLRFFDRKRDKNPDFNTPEIFLHKQRRHQYRTPEQMREDSRIPYVLN